MKKIKLMKSSKKEKKVRYSNIVHFLHIVYRFIFQEECHWKIRKGKVKQSIFRIINKYDGKNILDDLEKIKITLRMDLDFFMASDPASISKEEIILTYPGFYAIFAYRIAHYLDNLGISMIPRIITELAHSKTGIDIHPKATIGCPFFIDHGTGIVIGETTIIGNEVRLYHGVTLGALNLENTSDLHGVKRHPTIGDQVIIYANATILGGNTLIGNQSTIGCCMLITRSVEENTVLYVKNNQIIKKKKSH